MYLRCRLSIILTVLLVFSKPEIVFARTSPQHKLEIGMFLSFARLSETKQRSLPVKRAQGLGHVVGV